MIHLALAAALGLASMQSRGERLYQVHCSSCHGLALQGSQDGPPLIGQSAAGVDFMLQTGRMPAAVPGGEPSQKAPQFSQDDISAIDRYVTSTGLGDPQLPHLAAGDAARGRTIFALDCQQCHGVTAHGASVGFGTVAPSLMWTQGEQIAEAVRTGPGEMPRFGSDMMSDRDLDNLTTFVEYLQREKPTYNPGGLPLANVGPVAEGFIAWTFGLGLLFLFVRRVGSAD